MLVQKKDTEEIFALKSIRKEEVIEKNQVEHTKNERRILESVNFNYLLFLKNQDSKKLFF